MRIPFQPLSDSVYQSKYQLKDKFGNEIDKSRESTFLRVAKALAVNEVKQDYWEELFFSAMMRGAIPAGRILSNAGAGEHKPHTSNINCLAGETLVLTKQGLKSIETLIDFNSVEVLNGNNQWSKVAFKSYGIQPVYSLYFRYADSKTLVKVRTTANHRWIMPSGRIITSEFWLSGGPSKGFSSIENKFVPPFEVDTKQYDLGLIHGAVYGDGSSNPNSKNSFNLTLCAHKMELAALFSKLLGEFPKGPYTLNTEHKTQGLRFTQIRSELDLKELPPDGISDSYLKGFFAGLLATDGSVIGGSRSLTVTIYGNKQLIQFLELQLPRIGILSSGKSRKYYSKGEDSNFKRNKDVWAFFVHPGTVDSNDVLLSKQQSLFRVTENGLRRSKVWVFDHCDTTIETAEVFCCEESETQSFCILQGLLTGNCTVSSIVEDSIEGIGQAVKEAGITLSSGSGIGYCFSTLRPKGSFVSGVGAKTSGPLPFMDIFDKMCFTIASAGGRRGAQMATFDIAHPDVIDFIKAKREDGRFRQFNVSVLVPDQFMDFDDKEWTFRFPLRKTDPSYEVAHTLDRNQFSWGYWHIEDPNYIKNEQGLTLFKNYNTINKEELWNLVMQSAYDFAEPGVMFIDRFNQENNLYFAEYLNATNPCSEVMLPPGGSCLLGSINLTNFVREPFFDVRATFDFKAFKDVVRIFTRLLDNVVEFNGLPLKSQQHEILYKRRHGMGIMGLGSALTMLGLRYGSPEALDFASSVMQTLAVTGYEVGLELAKEKGPAPIMNEVFEVTPLMAQWNPAVKDLVGKKLLGKELFVESQYMQKLFAAGLSSKEEFARYGCRFTHHSSVAPTGTISLALSNNISGGLEPSFSHQYFRNLTVEGKKTRQQERVYSYEALLFKELNNIADEDLLTKLPDYFVTADTLSWKEHIDMLAQVQYWTDQGCSKTCNVPTNIPFEEFKDLYSYAYKAGCKAVATYRYNPETLGAVLSREEDLKKTRYQFKLEDGTVIECCGNDKLEYDGEITTAENLFNALKEGTYSKF